MNPAVALKQRVESILRKSSDMDVEHAPGRPNVLVATIDPEIRSGLAELLEAFSLNAIWLKGVETAKNTLSKESIAACLCGFWLQDGTYRELVRHVRRERVEIRMLRLAIETHSRSVRQQGSMIGPDLQVPGAA